MRIATFLIFGLALWMGVAEAASITIDVPSYCSSIQRVEGNKVFIAVPRECNLPGQAKVTVEPPANAKVIHYYENNMFVRDIPVAGADTSLANAATQAQKAAGGAVVGNIKNQNQGEGQKLAEKMAAVANSAEFQAKIAAEQKRIQQEVMGGGGSQHYADYGKKAEVKKKGAIALADDSRIYIFVSSSVPLSTLRAYAADLAKIGDDNAYMVIRGLVGGASKMTPTLAFSMDILKKDSSCRTGVEPCDAYPAGIVIDPLLFQRHGITKVPAIVYATNVDTVDPEGSEGDVENATLGGKVVVYGDVALDAALEEINKDAKSKALEAIIAKLRQGYYQESAK